MVGWAKCDRVVLLGNDKMPDTEGSKSKEDMYPEIDNV